MTDTKEVMNVFEEDKKYEELTFADDFMFCKVMTNNLDLCKELIEIILGRKIEKVVLSEAQKSIKNTYDGKGIRLDVYVKDTENTVYDLEMQAVDTKNLPKRSRYYQGMIDLNILNKGENYKKLKKSYIIFICKFDLFGAGLCRYTFENVCLEQLDIRLGDESTKIFINPYGNTENLSDELKAFLNYLCEESETDEFTRKLSAEVEKAKVQEEWRVEYMTLLMRDQENIEKGMEHERKEGIKTLINTLLELEMDKEIIMDKVCKKYGLTTEKALEYYKMCDNSNENVLYREVETRV